MLEKFLQIVNQVRINKQREALTALTAEMSLRDDLGFDSFDLAELTVRIEDEFGVDVFEDGLVTTVGEIIAKLK